MKRPTGKFWLDTFFARKTTEGALRQDLTGKTVVFTGGTDGMGREAVRLFAEMGANVCLISRNRLKTAMLVRELNAVPPKGQITSIDCDLSDLNQVRNAASTVIARFERVDFLINCAGVNYSERALSPDGYEMNLAVNYFGPFLLTELLLDNIKATPDARILHLSSATQEVAKLHLDDLQLERHKWSMMASYAQAKLCLIMHARDVASRLEGTTASVNSLNPGYIRTNLTRHVEGFERLFMILFGKLAAPTWIGGERIVAAAIDPKYVHASGQFVYEDMLMAPIAAALDEENVGRLMKVSRAMTGLVE